MDMICGLEDCKACYLIVAITNGLQEEKKDMMQKMILKMS